MMKPFSVFCFFITVLHSQAQAQAPTCTDGPYALARKFEGTWQEFTVIKAIEKLEGTLTTSFELNGCVITQKFISTDKSFSFMSFGYVDAKTGQWYETYVLSNGRVASYRWFVEGEHILTERVAGGDPATRRRLRITFLDQDLYQVIEEQSTDGKTWNAGARTITRRVK